LFGRTLPVDSTLLRGAYAFSSSTAALDQALVAESGCALPPAKRECL
jgi:hypothetical protein